MASHIRCISHHLLIACKSLTKINVYFSRHELKLLYSVWLPSKVRSSSYQTIFIPSSFFLDFFISFRYFILSTRSKIFLSLLSKHSRFLRSFFCVRMISITFLGSQDHPLSESAKDSSAAEMGVILSESIDSDFVWLGGLNYSLLGLTWSTFMSRTVKND